MLPTAADRPVENKERAPLSPVRQYMKIVVRYVGAVVAALGLAAGLAAQSNFDRALAGKSAGAPLRCVIPDLSANPVIQEGRAIAYFSGRQVYVNRFGRAGCNQLRTGRIIVTTGTSGRLCRNDPVNVIQPGGGPTYGFCTLGDFTPYSRAK